MHKTFDLLRFPTFVPSASPTSSHFTLPSSLQRRQDVLYSYLLARCTSLAEETKLHHFSRKTSALPRTRILHVQTTFFIVITIHSVAVNSRFICTTHSSHWRSICTIFILSASRPRHWTSTKLNLFDHFIILVYIHLLHSSSPSYATARASHSHLFPSVSISSTITYTSPVTYTAAACWSPRTAF